MQQETQWTSERVDLIKRTICPKGISDDAFALFLEQCKRSGLDPLLKQAFCVERRQNIGSREKPQWVTKHEFQPAEAGMLARAEHFPDYRGIMGAAVFSGDEILIDEGQGVVAHRYNPAKREGTLVGAWARVRRDGKDPVVRWVDFASRVQSTPLWGKDGAGMVLKCARVASLRTAYPEAFGGLYVAGERPDDGETGEDVEAPTVPVERPALPPPAPRETLESRVGERECVTVEARPVESAPQQAREPGSDDEADPMEADMQDIERKAKAARFMADLTPLKDRVMRGYTKGSSEYQRLNTALTAAYYRINPKPAPSAQKESAA